jgi:hypothetical protein
MIRKLLQSLLVITVAGALVSGLHAQTPKPIKPVGTPVTPTHPPPIAPVPAPASPPAQGSTAGPPCHGSDLNGHWDSPRALVTACLNKQVSLNSEPQTYQVMSVDEAGFVLKRVFASASEQQRGREATRFVPWSAVAYYEQFNQFVDIRLIGAQ